MKKVMAFTLALVLLLLCACRNSEEGQTNPTETAEQTLTTVPETTAPQPTETIPVPTETESVENTQPTETVSYDLAVLCNRSQNR